MSRTRERIGLLSAAILGAGLLIWGATSEDLMVGPSNLVIGPTGTLVIATAGENTADPTGSAPSADVWADALAPAVKTTTYTGVQAGAHTVYAELRHGLTQSAGTCTYPEGGTACTVSTFSDIPEAHCDLTRCAQTATVAAGTVTRVVIKHRGVYHGFGAGTAGGRDGTIIQVTNLNASGAGSLRQALIDACNANNRYIVFTVGGTITLPHVDNGGLNNSLKVCGNQITVDGFTAPDPGITVTQYGMNIHVLGPGGLADPKDTHDIILRNFRVRKNGFVSGHNCDGTPPDDCETQMINIETGASSYAGPFRVHDVVLDHMSISGSTDDMVGPSRADYNLTLSWSYLSAATGSNQGYLQDSGTHQVSLHHNRWTRSARRNPQITFHGGNPGDSSTTVPPIISADVRLNTMVAYKDGPAASHWGLLVATGAKVNGVKNYFTNDTTLAGDGYGLNNAIIVCNPKGAWLNPATMATCDFCSTDACRRSGDVYMDGNIFVPAGGAKAPAVDMNALDVNVTAAIAAPAINEEATATLGACAVRQRGGARPLDAHDQAQEAFYANPC